MYNMDYKLFHDSLLSMLLSYDIMFFPYFRISVSVGMNSGKSAGVSFHGEFLKAFTANRSGH